MTRLIARLAKISSSHRFRRLAADELWWKGTPYYITLPATPEEQMRGLEDLNYCVKRFFPLGVNWGSIQLNLNRLFNRLFNRVFILMWDTL